MVIPENCYRESSILIPSVMTEFFKVYIYCLIKMSYVMLYFINVFLRIILN